MGGVLASAGPAGSFRTTASNVAKRLFDRPEDLKAFVAAGGDSPEAMAAMKDYAAFSMRQAAVKDGLLSPAKLRAWVDDHGYVFEQFPDLKAKFADVKTAQASLDDALVRQKQALADYQSGAIKRLLNDADPVQVVGKALSDPPEFSSLVAAAGSEPAAKAGLKRATVEYMMSRALSTAEAGTSDLPQIKSDTLQKLFLQNRKTLGGLFDKDELANMQAVTADLQRANRSTVALKIPGGSNTAQDTGSRIQAVGRFLAQNAGKAVGALGGAVAGDVTGLAGGAVIGGAVDAAISARNARIDRAVVELLLNPKEASVWLGKAPTEAGPGALENFTRRLRVAATSQIMDAIESESREEERAR